MTNLIEANTMMAVEQYTDDIKYFKEYMVEEPHAPLDVDELNQLFEAYDYLANQKCICMRDLENCLESSDKNDRNEQTLRAMLNETRLDLLTVCTEVSDMIDDNLLQNAVGVLERALIYKMKAHFLRYKWKINNDINTYKEITDAYYEAMSIYQWNLTPSDPYLLQMAKLYTMHLNEGKNTNKALAVLMTVINNALEDLQDNNDQEEKSSIEPIITDLCDKLKEFQIIADQQLSKLIELIDPAVYQKYHYEEDDFGHLSSDCQIGNTDDL